MRILFCYTKPAIFLILHVTLTFMTSKIVLIFKISLEERLLGLGNTGQYSTYFVFFLPMSFTKL